MSSVAQIDQQTQVFKDAYASGKISFQEYRHAMNVQAANRAVAVEKEKPQEPSDYWTRENPSGNRLIQNPQYGVSFTATPGYQVVDHSIKEEGSNIVYQEQKIPEPVKQSDLSIASQMNIAFDLGLKTLNQLAEKESNPIVRELAKTEINVPIAAGLGVVTGGAATIEGSAYFVASIPGSVKKSVETGKLQYASGLEGFGMKTPQLAPTVLGAGINAALGNKQELNEIEQLPGFYRTGYAIGSVLTDLGLSMTEGAAISKVATIVRGAKVFQLTGAKEIESLTGTGKSLSRTSIIEPMLSSKRISVGAAKKLEEFNRYVTPNKIIMGGTELRAERYVDDTYRFLSTGANTVKNAEILIPTINKSLASKPSLISQIGYRLGRGSKTVNLVTYSEKKLIDQYGSFATKNAGLIQKGKPIIFQKEVATNIQEIYPFGKAYSRKIYTSTIIEGSIDPSIYLRLVKAVGPDVARQWYPQMGGINISLLEKATTKGSINAVKLGTNIVGFSFRKSSIGTNTILAGIPLGVRASKGESRTTGKTISRSITQTNPILNTPKIDQPKRSGFKGLSSQNYFVGTNQNNKSAPSSINILIPDTAQKNNDTVTPFYIPKTDQRNKPIVTPGYTQKTDQTPFNITRTKNIPVFDFPNYGRRQQFNPFFNFKVGGGSGRSGGSSASKGKWRKQDNPVKTVNAMLKTFGLNGKQNSKQSNPILGLKNRKKKRRR